MRRRRRIPIVTLALAIWASPLQAGPSEDQYVGAETCGGCHPKQFASHSVTGHALSLTRAASHPLAAAFPNAEPLFRKPHYRFRFSHDESQLRVQAWDDENVMDIPVEWAFGAGDQAVTFVTRVNEDWYLEHYHSYYPVLQAMAPTPGQHVLQPKALPEAMGLLYKTIDADTGILGCFECHSTGPVSVGPENELQPNELGVRCEACHGPGRPHLQAIERGDLASARRMVQNPARLSVEKLNQFCGQCHRPPASNGVEIDWGYSWNVRHQPVYLSQSKCLTESGGKLTCFTCHDPHDPLSKGEASYYNERCTACHTEPTAAPKQTCLADEPPNCIDCHMPRVSPQPPLRFTNHWIGIYHEGAKLKPESP